MDRKMGRLIILLTVLAMSLAFVCPDALAKDIDNPEPIIRENTGVNDGDDDDWDWATLPSEVRESRSSLFDSESKTAFRSSGLTASFAMKATLVSLRLTLLFRTY